jgi:hypothetical protein
MSKLIGFKAVNPRSIDWESRDCAVRASSIAMGLPYADIHLRYKAAGRRDRRGTCILIIADVLNHIEEYRFMSYEAPTLAQFVAKHKSGRWVICNSRHAWAMINGVVHDAGPIGARTRVIGAWRVA